jgi:hypothetical protein
MTEQNKRELYQKALDKLIQNIKAFIADPENEFSKWGDLLDTNKCNFCAIDEKAKYFWCIAKECPFYSSKHYSGFMYPCASPLMVKISNLKNKIEKIGFGIEKKQQAIDLATKGLAFVMKRAKSNGYIINE